MKLYILCSTVESVFSVQPSSAGGLRDDVADHVTGEIVGGGGGGSALRR